MRTVFKVTGHVIISDAVNNVYGCKFFSFCLKIALA